MAVKGLKHKAGLGIDDSGKSNFLSLKDDPGIEANYRQKIRVSGHFSGGWG
jgi:hypothetical protein